jgi:hypothetical protein
VLFEAYADHVAGMLSDGTSFEMVEDWIDRQSLSDDFKAALRLVAWAEQPPGKRRSIIAPQLVGWSASVSYGRPTVDSSPTR